MVSVKQTAVRGGSADIVDVEEETLERIVEDSMPSTKETTIIHFDNNFANGWSLNLNFGYPNRPNV